MSSIEKALTIYCTVVSFFCIALLISLLNIQNNIKDLNKNQEELQKEIEEVDNFNMEMWENQLKINDYLLGIPDETY